MGAGNFVLPLYFLSFDMGYFCLFMLMLTGDHAVIWDESM